jgi:hypothetical protein
MKWRMDWREVRRIPDSLELRSGLRIKEVVKY